MSLVEVENLKVMYQSFEAVKGINFYSDSGRVLGILGGNGAGKSSTLRSLATVTPASSGNIMVDGVSITDPRHIDYGRSLIGYCPDVGGLIPQATIKEHLTLALNLHNKMHLWDSAVNLVTRFGLGEFLHKQAGGFSHGMSRRFSVVLALLTSQKVLILDEPFDGVDPIGVEETIKAVNEAKAAGLTVIISTHLQSLLVEASDDILIMSRGEIIARGKAEKFRGEEGAELYKSILEGHLSSSSEAKPVTDSTLDAPTGSHESSLEDAETQDALASLDTPVEGAGEAQEGARTSQESRDARKPAHNPTAPYESVQSL